MQTTHCCTLPFVLAANIIHGYLTCSKNILNYRIIQAKKVPMVIIISSITLYIHICFVLIFTSIPYSTLERNIDIVVVLIFKSVNLHLLLSCDKNLFFKLSMNHLMLYICLLGEGRKKKREE